MSRLSMALRPQNPKQKLDASLATAFLLWQVAQSWSKAVAVAGDQLTSKSERAAFCCQNWWAQKAWQRPTQVLIQLPSWAGHD
jgi:hypothetical protein